MTDCVCAILINAVLTFPKLPFPMTLRNSKSLGLALAFSVSPRLITFSASSLPLASGGGAFLLGGKCCGVALAGGVAPFGDAEALDEPRGQLIGRIASLLVSSLHGCRTFATIIQIEWCHKIANESIRTGRLCFKNVNHHPLTAPSCDSNLLYHKTQPIVTV